MYSLEYIHAKRDYMGTVKDFRKQHGSCFCYSQTIMKLLSFLSKKYSLFSVMESETGCLLTSCVDLSLFGSISLITFGLPKVLTIKKKSNKKRNMENVTQSNSDGT